MSVFAKLLSVALALDPAATGGTYKIVDDAPQADAARSEITVEVVGTDSSGRERPRLPVRVIVTDSAGKHPDGSGQGVYSDGRFFADGKFSVELPDGFTKIALQSGPDYDPLTIEFDAKAGRSRTLRVTLRRWMAPDELGWYCGDNHVHAQHDARAVIKTSLAYTALQARANGLNYITEAGSDLSYDDVDKLDTERFLFRFAPEIRPGPFVGHLNTPGLKPPFSPERYEQLTGRSLPVQAVVEAVHESGGAVIYTHPFTPPHQMHWMGATEAISDAVLGRCADALDIDARHTEQLWFAMLNLGNKLACSNYTDCALGRLDTPSPGDGRVYCHASEFTYPAIVAAIRAGRTMATNGGPVFGLVTIDGHEPGDTIRLAVDRDYRVRAEIYSLHGLKTAEVICRGEVIHRFDVAGRRGRTELEQTLRPGDEYPLWYVLRVEDERGNWSITSPIYFDPPQQQTKQPPRGPAHALVLAIGNYTRFIELRKQFFAHAIVTVSPDDKLARVELLHDGKPIKTFEPDAGNQLADGKVPVTGINGEYAPGWVWHEEQGAAVHFQADWLVTESGWYALRARTAGGRDLESDAIHFDAAAPNSSAVSVVNMAGADTALSHWAYGEEMPLDEIRVPFAGDHWWYPQRPYWRLRTTFGKHTSELGLHDDTRSKSFRSAPAQQQRSRE